MLDREALVQQQPLEVRQRGRRPTMGHPARPDGYRTFRCDRTHSIVLTAFTWDRAFVLSKMART